MLNYKGSRGLDCFTVCKGNKLGCISSSALSKCTQVRNIACTSRCPCSLKKLRVRRLNSAAPTKTLNSHWSPEQTAGKWLRIVNSPICPQKAALCGLCKWSCIDIIFCTGSLTSACAVRSQWDFFLPPRCLLLRCLSQQPLPPPPRSHCVPLLTPFSLPFYSICVLNQHFRAVCRRPAERQSMDLIMLPQIHIPPHICFPFSLCHFIKWLISAAAKAGQHHKLQWKLKLLWILNFPLARV